MTSHWCLTPLTWLCLLEPHGTLIFIMSIGIGLEIGNTAVRAAVLERQGKALKLLAWREVPCETSSPESLTQGLTHVRRVFRSRLPDQ